MSRKIKRETDRFRAQFDDGREITVVEYTDFIQISTRAGNSELAGLKELVTPSGGHLNFIEDGVFQLVATGETVRRV